MTAGGGGGGAQLLRDAGAAAGVGRPVIGGGWLNPSQAPSGGAPRPHPDGYMLYPGTDVPCDAGPCDLARVEGGSAGSCMAACNATGGCAGFSFYAGNGSCVLKSYAGPGAPGGGDFYVRVLPEVAWEWRGTYNDAPPVCYFGPNDTNAGTCPEYVNSWWPNATAGGAKVFPYAEVLMYQAQARGNQSRDGVPYLPNVIAGFDPRPWEERGPSFTDPTADEWASALTQVFTPPPPRPRPRGAHPVPYPEC